MEHQLSLQEQQLLSPEILPQSLLARLHQLREESPPNTNRSPAHDSLYQISNQILKQPVLYLPDPLEHNRNEYRKRLTRLRDHEGLSG